MKEIGPRLSSDVNSIDRSFVDKHQFE